MIEMKHINLSFKDKNLFTDQEIKIDSGKITLITGESGSGKSTLLFELARLTDYANKEYIYENGKMSDLDEESFRGKIAFVFQDCRLFNDLSVIQNIEFFSQLGEVEFKKDKMMNLLDELDLNIDLNGEVKVLSGGQKQRLLILCCMMKEPEIIFFDEPTAYLDDENRRRMRKIIYDLCYKYHKTVVIASHDLDMLEIADKHYHIESQQILLKKNIIKENKNLIARKTIQTFPLNYYLHAQKSNKVHYKRNIIIAGHNYRSHFSRLKTLDIGSKIWFIDVEGNRFEYKVSDIEIIKGTDVKQMEKGKWDMTLFTCTYGGQNRMALRCTITNMLAGGN